MARKDNERQRLYCHEHQELSEVELVEKSENVYGYLLSCGCSRGRYLPTTTGRVSLEHASTAEGIAAFQADLKADMANAQFGKYRQQLSDDL